MRASLRPDGLLLSESPGCFWLLGGYLGFLVGVVLLALLPVFPAQVPAWLPPLDLGLGLLVIAFSLYLLSEAPLSRVVIRRSRRDLTIIQRRFLRRSRQRFSLDEIHSVYLVASVDYDSSPLFILKLRLADGRELPLTQSWFNDRARLEEMLSLLKDYLPVEGAKQA